MGLDMYLSATRYCSGGYDHAKPEEKKLFSDIIQSVGLNPEQAERSLTLKVGVGYWRKANAIHSWFVREVQDGKDECQSSHVSREQLLELKVLCQKVLASKRKKGKVYQGTTWTDGKKEDMYEDGEVLADTKLAEELLPTQSGFFFGGTGYDQYYLQDLEETVKIVDNALALPEAEWDFEYQASW